MKHLRPLVDPGQAAGQDSANVPEASALRVPDKSPVPSQTPHEMPLKANSDEIEMTFDGNAHAFELTLGEIQRGDGEWGRGTCDWSYRLLLSGLLFRFASSVMSDGR
jgi:hypothetical protein